MTNATDLAQAYATYRPLLFKALGRLAGHGYAVPPDEGLGLVHDFFLEAWPGLQDRYDPRRGSFSTYLFGSFVHFARPRIVRMQRWQQQLGDPDQGSGSVSESTSDIDLDVARVREALGRLPPSDRELLIARFASEGSVRALAKQMSTSRYHIRERLVEALARFVTVLDDRSLLSADDRPLARLLWLDQRSLDDAAAHLRLTLPQAKASKVRILSTLCRAVHVGGANRSTERSMQPTLCEIWREFATHPENGDLRDRVVAARKELSDHLDDCVACGESTPDQPERLASIYSALAGDDDLLAERDSDALLQLRDSIDANVREAVEQVLYTALPPSLVARVANVDALVVFRSVDALALLIDRHWRHQPDANQTMVLSGDGLFRKASDTDLLTRLESRLGLLREIRIMSKTEDPIADRLLMWTLLSARSHPRLLPGVVTAPLANDRLEVRAVNRPLELDLAQMWSPQAIAQVQHATTEHGHAVANLGRIRQGQT